MVKWYKKSLKKTGKTDILNQEQVIEKESQKNI